MAVHRIPAQAQEDLLDVRRRHLRAVRRGVRRNGTVIFQKQDARAAAEHDRPVHAEPHVEHFFADALRHPPEQRREAPEKGHRLFKVHIHHQSFSVWFILWTGTPV